MKKIFALLGVIGLVYLSAPQVLETNANGLPYSTYTYSSSMGDIVWTQDAYLPLSISTELGGETLDTPSDITVDANDIIYVADTGNSRIIRYDLENDTVSSFGETILDQPTGVHVDSQGSVYVADFGTKEAYKFVYNEGTSTFDLAVTYAKPVGTPYFSDEDAFDPNKIVTDTGLNVYILLSGNINGLAEFKNDGDFFGYFGGNRIPDTWDNTVKSLLFDEQQRREWFQMIPDPVYNVAVDQAGLILTTTKDNAGYLKLNIANDVYSKSAWGFDNVEDLFVGPYDTVFAITDDGYITEYDPNGSVLFIFSGPDQYGQKGLFKSPKGIAVDSKNNIYAVDDTTNSLQVFIPTDFASLVHQAIKLYFDGRYAEALEPWQQVLKMNRLFDLANQGIGDAYFAQGNYAEAMKYYKIARDRDGYSNAYWEVRNAALLKSGPIIIYVLIAIIVLVIVNKFVPFMHYVKQGTKGADTSMRKFKLYREMTFPFYIFRHPIDGFYGVKREKKGSNLSAAIYLALFFGMYILWIYATNFQFNDNIPSEIDFFEQIIAIFVPFTLWVVANYLVCSIRDGEGKLSDVFQSSAYSLLPMIITFPILTLISQVLTQNEVFVYDTILTLGVVVTVIYFVVMVKEIHYYDMKPTIGNILISLFTGIMILAVLLIVYFLLNEIYGVFADIIQEVISRV